MEKFFKPGPEQARQLDQADPLKEFRERFYIGSGEIYMDGNSLGLCSQDAEAAVLNVLELWKTEGINLWGVEGGKYFLYPSRLGARMAGLIGAQAEEVTISNSTTINIHQCLATFYRPESKRYKILVDDLNFATDRHAVDSQVLLRGYQLAEAVKVLVSPDGRTIDEEALIEAMTEDVALVFLPSVLYRSAQLLNLERITAEARRRDIVIGWVYAIQSGQCLMIFKKSPLTSRSGAIINTSRPGREPLPGSTSTAAISAGDPAWPAGTATSNPACSSSITAINTLTTPTAG